MKAENLVYEESDGIVDEDSLEYQLTYHILQSEHHQALGFSFDETDKYRNWFNGYSVEENGLFQDWSKYSKAENDNSSALRSKRSTIRENIADKSEDRGFEIEALSEMLRGKREPSRFEHKISVSRSSGNISTPRFGRPFAVSAFVNYPIVFSFAVDYSGVDIPSTGTVGLILDIDVNIQPAHEIVKLCGKDVHR